MDEIAHHLRTLAIAVLILLAGSAFAATEAPELQQLRGQLKKAQDAEDEPAVIELSRRIVGIAPNDAETWDTLAQTQLESEDLDGLGRTLDPWQKAFRRPPATIEDFRAGLCFKRKDYQCAEQDWLAFIATKPPRVDVATDRQPGRVMRSAGALGRPRGIPLEGSRGAGHRHAPRVACGRFPASA